MQDKKTNSDSTDSGKKTPAYYSVLFKSREGGGRYVKRSRTVASFRPIKLLESLVDTASYASTRAYGWFAMTFGLLSLFLHLAEYYFSSSPSDELSQLVIGAVFALLSIPLMLVDIPMCTALQRFPVTDYILFEFFSIKRTAEVKRIRSGRPIIGALFGLITAVFGFFFPMEWVVVVLVSMLVVTVSFVSPEFPLLLMLILVPYTTLFSHFGEILIAVSILALLSFFAKVMLGKRHYSVGISDICILVFAATIVVFGVIGGGRDSTGVSLMLVALTLGYIPAANIIVNRRLADCAIDAIVFSSFPVCIFAIAQYIVNLFASTRAPSSSVMSSPYILATYLCILLVIVVSSVSGVNGPVKRGAYITLLPLLLFALITTECIPVLIVLVALVIARDIIRSRKLAKEFLILLAVAPSLVFLLPTSALTAISSLSPRGTTLVELRAEFIRSFQIFSKSIFVGVGAADLSGDTPVAMLNSVLGLGYRFGIFAVIVLCVVCAIRLYQDTHYSSLLKSSQLSVFSNMTTIAMFTLAACGWFCDAFADLGLYCLFFVLFGLNTAAMRISRSEHQERELYLKDQKDIDFSAVDIFLHR